ncbi:hypothetical protein G7068_08460 [Leucobacter viscericola]|uniref:Uncharacterized protein n=1 Tax=Leucobacter viscericola TaxID=2714935 RepID=A0A6G7XFI0_9MICO|nr:hypothetical protein [Leucobacter viscericola]QIK63226.1 hypothetical protein G7068_08460 [Leucobacter viscericola]
MKILRNTTIWVATGLLLVGLAGCAGQEARPSGLPKGLPAPVAVESGAVSNAVEGEGQWSFSLTVSNKEEQQAALDKLKDAGFRVFDDSTVGERKTYALSKDRLSVTLVFDTVAGKPAVIYNVVEAPEDPEGD